MRADALGDGVDARLLPKIDRDSRRCWRAPRGRASASAACSRAAAGGRKRRCRRSAQARVIVGPVDPRRRARREQPPFAPRPCAMQRDAGVACEQALNGREPSVGRIAVEARRLGEQARGHNRRRGRAACNGVPSAPTTARCLPSPVTSRSGAGASAAPTAPTSERDEPEQPQPRCSTGTATGRRRPSGRMPRPASTAAARPRRWPRRRRGRARAARRSPRRTATTKACPSPTASSSSAPASSGMMTKVVSGMAMMLAPTP